MATIVNYLFLHNHLVSVIYKHVLPCCTNYNYITNFNETHRPSKTWYFPISNFKMTIFNSSIHLSHQYLLHGLLQKKWFLVHKWSSMKKIFFLYVYTYISLQFIYIYISHNYFTNLQQYLSCFVWCTNDKFTHFLQNIVYKSWWYVQVNMIQSQTYV